MTSLSSAQRLAAGVHAPPTLAKGFATTQAAWRFYNNARVTLPALAAPLLEHARSSATECCDQWLLAILDWSNLHYNGHGSKADRLALSNNDDRGYQMLTALGVSDRDGSPLAPLCLELRAQDGLHTTRSPRVQKPLSSLDGLGPVMDHVAAQCPARPIVFIIDRQADSVAHYRRWEAAGRKFVIRASDSRLVLHQGREQKLPQVAEGLGPPVQAHAPRAVQGQGRRAMGGRDDNRAEPAGPSTPG